MKRILTITAMLVAFGFFAQAQTNNQLKLNQVKIVTAEETVPTGKVWKVVSVVYAISATHKGMASSTSSGCGGSYVRNYAITVNGVETKVGTGRVMYGDDPYINSEFPIWLPAGSTLDGGPCLSQVSVLEFNIVPE